MYVARVRQVERKNIWTDNEKYRAVSDDYDRSDENDYAEGSDKNGFLLKNEVSTSVVFSPPTPFLWSTSG